MFEDLSRDNIDQYVVVELGRPKWRDARVKVIEFAGQDVAGGGVVEPPATAGGQQHNGRQDQDGLDLDTYLYLVPLLM